MAVTPFKEIQRLPLRRAAIAFAIPPCGIRSVETVTYDPEHDYGGYGIRSTREGKAYLATGNRGVRLTLADAEIVIVGSQKSKELADVLSRAASR